MNIKILCFFWPFWILYQQSPFSVNETILSLFSNLKYKFHYFVLKLSFFYILIPKNQNNRAHITPLALTRLKSIKSRHQIDIFRNEAFLYLPFQSFLCHSFPHWLIELLLRDILLLRYWIVLAYMVKIICKKYIFIHTFKLETEFVLKQTLRLPTNPLFWLSLLVTRVMTNHRPTKH